MFVFDDMHIRPVEEKDLSFIKKLRNDPSTWVNLTSIEMLTDQNQIEWLHSLQGSNKKYFIACRVIDNVPVGMIRTDFIDHINSNIQIGADVAPEFRGQGYGDKIYKLFLRYCFDYLNMHRVWLLVVDYNNIGLHLYLKNGFKEEGRQREAILREGKYHDYVMMSILEREYRSKPNYSFGY
mgnify:CR=1 FL=1